MFGALSYFLVAYALFAGTVVFLMTFGRSPVFAGTFVERASDFVAGGCVDSGLELVEKLCGSGAAQRVDSVLSYCCWQNNPILPATYFLMVAACYALYYYRVFSWFPTSATPLWHKYTGTASVLCCCFMWFRVFYSNPGLITKENLPFWLAADPPGDLIYPDKQCPTCELPRPARSKHCALCKGCIAREDHHCAPSTRYLQHIYFLGFVAANIFMMWYGSILAVATMWGALNDARMLDRPFYDASGKRTTLRSDWRALLKFAMRRFPVAPAIAAFLAVCAVILMGFFGYNAWNISSGMTGNDRHKLAEVNRKIVIERRAKSYVADSPKHLPTPKRLSYSQGFLRNWLEVLFPGTIRPKVPVEALSSASLPSHGKGSKEQPRSSTHKED